jgi:putative ATPase
MRYTPGMDLFAGQREAALKKVQPLAVRMRPQALEEFVGQEHFAGDGALLRRLLEADRLTSAIFFGPPGSGKTTLARLIANHTNADFETLHAAEAGVKDVRQVIHAARERLTASGQRTVLFLDEIHRFNRAQQDVLLKDVEEGVLILIGATTENPFFSVNRPLVSRSQIFELHSLSVDQIEQLLRRALADEERGLGATGVKCDDEALHYLATRADGDARRALNALEVAVLSQQKSGTPHVDVAAAAESMQKKLVPYDAMGDDHYDVASALIKSMRGSDPDATLYWLARMLEGGEDPLFIARRIAICASEDVGNADPQAAVLASAALHITANIGLPECQFALAQAAVYNALAPKSNAVTMAIGQARQDVRDGVTLPVPNHLRDAHYSGAQRLGRGAGYVYPHNSPEGYVEQDYLGTAKTYYNPTNRGREGELSQRLRELRERMRAEVEEPRQD